MLHTRKAQTEEAQAAMAERNAHRIEIVKRALGDKYAHHPANRVLPFHMRQARLAQLIQHHSEPGLVIAAIRG
jgi:short subunit dehydrogenase-like uncharacterized protein